MSICVLTRESNNNNNTNNNKARRQMFANVFFPISGLIIMTDSGRLVN